MKVPGGAYRYVRNPGELLGVLALSAAAIIRPSGLLAAGAIWALLVGEALTRLDERGQKGEDFARWRRRVRRWRPRLRPYDPAREADEPPLPPERTSAPARRVVLFDGNCTFCRAQSDRLRRWAPDVEMRDFQKPGVLDAFPGVTHEVCMRAMVLVDQEGRVFQGFEAIARAVGRAAYLYYVPGVRLACDLAYGVIARNRYRLAAKDCPDGTCPAHSGEPPKRPKTPKTPK